MGETKGCELCKRAARMYCESDQASLCWDCDARVHGANFLVARHTRCLLCRRCQALTPWRASGARLGPTVSFCEGCAVGGCEEEKVEGSGERRSDEEDDDDGGDEEDEDLDEEEEEEEEEDGENQVVPGTMTPPPVASSSSSEESSSRIHGGFFKRVREDADLASEDDISCSSAADDEATSFTGSARRKARLGSVQGRVQPAMGSSRFLGIHGDRDLSAVDLVSSRPRSPPI